MADSTESGTAFSRPERPRLPLRALLFSAAAAVPYLAAAGNLTCDFRQSHLPHHVLTAHAMLHGRLFIRADEIEQRVQAQHTETRQRVETILRQRGETPPPLVDAYVRRELTHDLLAIGDRYYIYWGPLAAVAAMPWVAVFGPEASDRLFQAILGAANVGLAYWMFRRVDRAGLLPLDERACTAMTVLFAFGTVHFYLSCDSAIYYAVQVTTLAPILLSIIALCGERLSVRSCLLAGAMLGAAILGRLIVVLAVPFYVVMIWHRMRPDRTGRWREYALCNSALAAAVAIAGVAQAAWNYGRLGDPFDTGHGYAALTGGDPRMLAEWKEYGRFSTHYLARNAKHYLWCCDFPTRFGRTWFCDEGNSLFLVTPPLVFMGLAWRRRNAFTLALACGAAPVFGALLLFHGTGFAQFGNRYLLDVMPFLLLLAASGMRGRIGCLESSLVVAAIAMNVFGTARFHFRRVGPLNEFVSPLNLAVAAAVAIIVVCTVIRQRDAARPPA